MLAHVKWFTSNNEWTFPDLVVWEWMLVFVLGAAGFATLGRVDAWIKNSGLWRSIDKIGRPLRNVAPLIVRISTAVLLFFNIKHEQLLAPNVDSDDSLLALLITVIFAMSAVSIAAGFMTRAGLIGFLLAYVLILFKASVVDWLDHIDYVGLAGYLWLRGPGRYSADHQLGSIQLVTPEHMSLSLHIYRIGVGVALVVLSFSEKLAGIGIAEQFLELHQWNLLRFVGVSDRSFIIIIGAIELMLGIALIVNFAPRLILLIILTTMIQTALLLGIEEVYGHLFAVGIFVAIWVNDRVTRSKIVLPQTQLVRLMFADLSHFIAGFGHSGKRSYPQDDYRSH